MWYSYRQNNSGGVFSFDPDRGISVNVYIEADNPDEADRRAKEVGLYFDGVEKGLDCECCGNRWYTAGSAFQEDPPAPDEPFKEGMFSMKWVEGPQTFVHPKEGAFYSAHTESLSG